MGKMSLLDVAQPVVYYSNNGEFALKDSIRGMTHEWTSNAKADYYLDHKGVKIVIEKPEREYDIRELVAYLRKTFNLMLAEGKQIIVNGRILEPLHDMDVNAVHICEVIGDFEVTGVLEPSENHYGRVDVYIKKVFNCNLTIDLNRKFMGW